jgi:hypothetical protein
VSLEKAAPLIEERLPRFACLYLFLSLWFYDDKHFYLLFCKLGDLGDAVTPGAVDDDAARQHDDERQDDGRGQTELEEPEGEEDGIAIGGRNV